MTNWVSELCDHIGVQSSYRGFDGETVQVSRDTQCAVLRAMEIDVLTEGDAKAHLKQLQVNEAQRPLPMDVVVMAGKRCVLPLKHSTEWVLEAEETGAVLAQGRDTESLTLPALPMGIHLLRLQSDGRAFTTSVLARPARAVSLADRLSQPRIWGVMAALYGLTDGGSLKIGTYGAMGDYAAAFAAYGADFLGVNPVHAMGRTRPRNVISPYSPSHRGFLNTWHCAGGARSTGDQAEFVDYRVALQTNEQELDGQYAAFAALPDASTKQQAFRRFLTEAGPDLQTFALFEAISSEHGADWRDWPERYRAQDPQALSDVEARHETDIHRTKWAQWQAHTQLSKAQETAVSVGMRVGLYLDLAVGPRLGGAETWGRDTSLISGATLGAPPDPLGPTGQSWGLAPMSPLKCRAEGFAGFARLLRQNMRHAGMIRIDHILGLMRSFWIPEGHAEGAYVSYPFKSLLAVMMIESVRNNTVVVGEDLGLVPAGLRDELAKSGIYGLDVLQYMRTPTGGFAKPGKVRQQAVCTFATHDTPTIAGFFAGEDLAFRQQVGDIDEKTMREGHADRTRAQHRLKTKDPVSDVHRYLARSRASMVAVQIDDVARRTRQQNMPGTVDSYPNWQLKAPFTVNQISSSADFAQLGADMRAENRSNLKAMEREHALQDGQDSAH